MKKYPFALMLVCFSILTQIISLGSLPDEPPEEENIREISLTNFESTRTSL